MGKILCWSVRNILDLYVDGRLSEGWSRRTERHLKSCAWCRVQVDEMKGLKAILRRATAVAAPKGLTESILKQLEQPQAPLPAWNPVWRLTPAQAAALVYLAFLAGANALPGVPSQSYGNPSEASR